MRGFQGKQRAGGSGHPKAHRWGLPGSFKKSLDVAFSFQVRHEWSRRAEEWGRGVVQGRIVSVVRGIVSALSTADETSVPNANGREPETSTFMEELEIVKRATSNKLFRQAQRYIPGGVNSPVRAFRSVGGTPLFITRARGARLTDADGNVYLDYVASWGPMILGHAHPVVTRTIQQAARHGTSYGAPTEREVTLARMICDALPSVEKVRLVSSGTEAVMSAIRVARGVTKRDAILKFEGCYHGHADHLLVKAGSGAATLGLPDSPGVPKAAAGQTLTAAYNDIAAVRSMVRKHWRKLACIIVEPIAGNMGVVLPREDFLRQLRTLTRQHGILLIFDEVISGFRVAYGGAQTVYGVTPDLTCLGKNHRWGPARRSLRRFARDHGPCGSRGSGLSGRDAFRQSVGRDRGNRNVDTTQKIRGV